jgi:hypothetical protein
LRLEVGALGLGVGAVCWGWGLGLEVWVRVGVRAGGWRFPLGVKVRAVGWGPFQLFTFIAIGTGYK